MPYATSDPKRASRSLAVRTLCFECGFVHSSNATCASERAARRAATARVIRQAKRDQARREALADAQEGSES